MAAASLAKLSQWEITAVDIITAGLSLADAAEFYEELQRVARAHAREEGSEAELWRDVVERGLLQQSHPHQLHQLVSVLRNGMLQLEVHLLTGSLPC